MKKYRMLRVIEYTGTEEFIDSHRINRGIKGTKMLANGTIREAILGDTEEVLDTQEVLGDEYEDV